MFSKAFIKTRPFLCKRHIFQDHEFACHGLDEPQDKRSDGAGNEISRSGTSNVSFHNANGWKVQQTSNTKMFCSHISSKTIKSALWKAINSFSLQVAVAGVSAEEIVFGAKKPVIKRLFGTKSKRSSKKDKVGIQESSSETDMEIEFENDDSGYNVSDGDAESLYCTGVFLA